jgi:hypothetical protein
MNFPPGSTRGEWIDQRTQPGVLAMLQIFSTITSERHCKFIQMSKLNFMVSSSLPYTQDLGFDLKGILGAFRKRCGMAIKGQEEAGFTSHYWIAMCNILEYDREL